jgi:hypothetical protein
MLHPAHHHQVSYEDHKFSNNDINIDPSLTPSPQLFRQPLRDSLDPANITPTQSNAENYTLQEYRSQVIDNTRGCNHYSCVQHSCKTSSIPVVLWQSPPNDKPFQALKRRLSSTARTPTPKRRQVRTAEGGSESPADGKTQIETPVTPIKHHPFAKVIKPKSKKSRDATSEKSRKIQATKALFDQTVEKYTQDQLASMWVRNTSCFKRGRYIDIGKDNNYDQAQDLVVKLQNGKSGVTYFFHPPPKNWDSPKPITKLNHWRTQLLRRVTGQNQRRGLQPYFDEQRQYLADLLKGMRPDEKPDKARITDAFNKHFAGQLGQDGSILKARTEASLGAEITRHWDLYIKGDYPTRRITNWYRNLIDPTDKKIDTSGTAKLESSSFVDGIWEENPEDGELVQ